MVKLLLKIGLFLLLLIVIKIPFFLSFEDELTYRRKEFRQKEFDTVFIGTSRTRSGVLPSYFDHLNQYQTKSYNFGVAAGVSNQTFNRCEEIILSNPSVKTIFVELSGGIESVQVYEEPWRTFSLKEHWRATRQLQWRKAQIYNERLIITFFKPNIFRNYVNNNISLDEVFEKNKIYQEPVKIDAISSVRNRNLQIENGRISGEDMPLNKVYWERILNVIKLAEEKNIKLYFFIPPRLETDNELKMIYPVWQKLDEKYKLRVNHYEDALYADEYSVDEFHLNHQGALRFTQNMVEVFKLNEK